MVSSNCMVYMCDRVDQLPWNFHIIGDKLINPIIGFYIPIIRIPSLKVGWVYPQYSDFWPWHICNYIPYMDSYWGSPLTLSNTFFVGLGAPGPKIFFNVFHGEKGPTLAKKGPAQKVLQEYHDCLAILRDLFGMVKWPFPGLSDLQLL